MLACLPESLEMRSYSVTTRARRSPRQAMSSGSCATSWAPTSPSPRAVPRPAGAGRGGHPERPPHRRLPCASPPDVTAAGAEFVDAAAVVDRAGDLRPRLARPPDLDAGVHAGPAVLIAEATGLRPHVRSQELRAPALSGRGMGFGACRPGLRTGMGAMSPRMVTQRVSVKASRLAVPPKRVPVPGVQDAAERRVRPRRRPVCSLMCTIPVGMRRARSRPRMTSLVRMPSDRPYSLRAAISATSSALPNLQHRGDRAEDLVRVGGHVRRDVGQHGGPVEQALVGAARRELRPGARGRGDQGVHLVPLPLVDDRAERDLAAGRVADRQVLAPSRPGPRRSRRRWPRARGAARSSCRSGPGAGTIPTRRPRRPVRGRRRRG